MSKLQLLRSTALGLPIVVLSAVAALAQQPPAVRNITPVTDAMLRNPPPGDWLMWRRTYDAWGYSPLEQINKANVKNLKPAWTWSLTNGATETTPIVHDGVLFIFNYADKIQALNAATGDLIWEYKRDLPAKLVTAGGNPLAKRNMAIYEDKLIVATSDAHLVALDAKTGKVVWDHTTADWNKGWRYTGGPFIANGTIVQGMTGCGNAQPGGCYITGHDPKTGAEKWRVHTIAQPGDPDFNTWNGLPLEVALRRLGLDLRQLRSGPEPRVLRHRPALSVDRGDERPAAQEGGHAEQRPLHRLHARDRRRHRQAQVVPAAPRERHLGPRLCLRAHADRPDGQRRAAQGAGHDRQARHHRGDRPHQRPMALAQGNRAAERRVGDRSQDRRQDHQPGIDPARSDRPRSTARPIRAAAAGRRRPTARRPASSICRSTSTARTPRRPRSTRARPIPAAAARSTRACRCPTATARSAASTRSSCPTSRRCGPIARARRRPARCCRPAAASCSAAPGTAGSAPSTTPPGKVLWETRLNNAVNSFPVSYTRQRQAVCRGRGRQRLEPGPLARDADARDQESGWRARRCGSSRCRTDTPCPAGRIR